jgi:hypothetical protein
VRGAGEDGGAQVVVGERRPVEVDGQGAAGLQEGQYQPAADLGGLGAVGLVGEDHEPLAWHVLEHGQHVLGAVDADGEVDGSEDGFGTAGVREASHLDAAALRGRSVLAFEHPGRVVGVGVDPAEAGARDGLVVHDDQAVGPVRASREADESPGELEGAAGGHLDGSVRCLTADRHAVVGAGCHGQGACRAGAPPAGNSLDDVGVSADHLASGDDLRLAVRPGDLVPPGRAPRRVLGGHTGGGAARGLRRGSLICTHGSDPLVSVSGRTPSTPPRVRSAVLRRGARPTRCVRCAARGRHGAGCCGARRRGAVGPAR